MSISLSQVQLNEKNDLEKLLHRYFQELLNNPNPEPYQYLDLYWKDSTRTPLFIKNNSEILGFALINRYTFIAENSHSIAEFYILPSHRKQGIGQKAATQIINQYPGNWEIRILKDNQSGLIFWEKVISRIASSFIKQERASQEFSGMIFTFQIK